MPVSVGLNQFAELYQQQYLRSAKYWGSKNSSIKARLYVRCRARKLLGSGNVSLIKDLELTLTLSSVIELGDKVAAHKNVSDVK